MFDITDFRRLIRQKLETRNIVIWGSSDKAKQFYLDYKNRYHITACLSQEREHREYLIDAEDGLKITDWSQYKRKDNDYIIISENPYAHRENQLTAEGLVLHEDYVGMQIAEFISSGKKLAIMAGNCQIATVFEYISQIKAFTDEYCILKFSTHYWKSRWSMKSISILKDMCDLYLCMNHEEDDSLFFKKEELPASCKIVTLPYAMGRFYWPQLKSGWKSMVNELYIKNRALIRHGPFEVGDTNINRMITEGKGVEEIVAALSDENFYTEEQVKKHLDKVIRVQEYEEQGCDIHILPYIKENMGKIMLYRDMTHLHPILACEYARQILLYLDIDDTEIDAILEAGMDNAVYRSHSEHCTQVPVYPSVAKHMGLEWYRRDMTWDVTFYSGLRKLTFEEYIRAYYNLCTKMKEIMEEW